MEWRTILCGRFLLQCRLWKGRIGTLVSAWLFNNKGLRSGKPSFHFELVNAKLTAAIPYKYDGREVVKIGVNVSTENNVRTITDWKVEK
jgi:hypothetical protein